MNYSKINGFLQIHKYRRQKLWKRIQDSVKILKRGAKMMQRVEFNFVRQSNLYIHETTSVFAHLIKIIFCHFYFSAYTLIGFFCQKVAPSDINEVYFLKRNT